MPKQIHDIMKFFEKARTADAKYVKIVENKATGVTKFKLRTKKYLYTLRLADKKKAGIVRSSFPPTLDKIDI